MRVDQEGFSFFGDAPAVNVDAVEDGECFCEGGGRGAGQNCAVLWRESHLEESQEEREEGL